MKDIAHIEGQVAHSDQVITNVSRASKNAARGSADDLRTSDYQESLDELTELKKQGQQLEAELAQLGKPYQLAKQKEIREKYRNPDQSLKEWIAEKERIMNRRAIIIASLADVRGRQRMLKNRISTIPAKERGDQGADVWAKWDERDRIWSRMMKDIHAIRELLEKRSE